jgi:hypothetical protein
MRYVLLMKLLNANAMEGYHCAAALADICFAAAQVSLTYMKCSLKATFLTTL